jgi:hypothetical protein
VLGFAEPSDALAERARSAVLIDDRITNAAERVEGQQQNAARSMLALYPPVTFAVPPTIGKE